MKTNPQSVRNVAIIVLAWLILQLGGIFSPGLLDDVDSVYIEIAREMLHRHDYVTPYIDGIRFFDKPPLMYWLAASSMRLLGETDWAARIPIALAVLGLLFAVYALGKRLYGEPGGFYAALAMATSIGPYLYTRFFIPDILICLWMTLGVHCFLIALDRAAERKSALWPTLGFSAVLALNLLTKGLIGLVFPFGFVFFYLLLTRPKLPGSPSQSASSIEMGSIAAQLPRPQSLLRKLSLVQGTVAFLAIALPWHVLAALRNPAIAMPAGLGLPARAGWAWFYLYNEHVARFLGKRIPHDYGQTPVWLFWLYAVLWMMPWAAFLPAAIAQVRRHLGHRFPVTIREREAALTVTVWSLLVLVFFTLSSRQEYYSLPALPALALMLGGALAAPSKLILRCHRWLLLPIATVVSAVTAWFALTAPRPAPGTDLSTLLSQNPDLYNLSLGHLFDLTGAAMGLFRGPLIAVSAGMLLVGLISYLLRARHSHAADLTLAAGMTIVLLAMHEGLVRFNPILGSKPLADAILAEQSRTPRPDDLILLDGELTSGSTLLFYTGQPVHLVNGRVNGPWFGSFWPDSPQIFEDESSLRTVWTGPRRVFLLTYNPTQRQRDLPATHTLATAGGKTIMTNR